MYVSKNIATSVIKFINNLIYLFTCYIMSHMRVIAGIYRGRQLKSPKSEVIKPTLDRVKEAMFGSIQFYLKNARVLDLFSGSGALGIEALSRGARIVEFVDKDIDSVKLTKENLTGINNVVVNHDDYLNYLSKVKEGFDVIFIDPPYATNYAKQAIEYIDEQKLLNENGILVWEKAFSSHIDLVLKNLSVVKIKKYGTVQVVYLASIDRLNNL